MKSILLFCLSLIVTLSAYSQTEHIVKFDVDIEVHQDRSLKITEYIQVYATGNRIKRGITRALPTSRILGRHGRVSVRYKIISLEKNNEKEPYHVIEENQFKTLYIGSRDRYLKAGYYDYKIEYEVQNQIAFMEGYDELYWNALGHLNQFQIKEANVKVHFPDGAKILQDAAYSGFQNEMKKDFTKEREGNSFIYTMNKELKPREGFTFAVGVEPGFYKEPNFFQKFGLIASFLISVLLLVFYYIITWLKYGIDPETPASYPIPYAPNNLSPASVAYILKERNPRGAFTSSIVALINAELIRVVNGGSKGVFGSEEYIITKLGNYKNDLPDEQKAIMDMLFKSGKQVKIDSTYKANVANANKYHSQSLKDQHHAFVDEGNNRMKLILPFIFLVLSTGILCLLFFTTSYSEFFHPSMLAVFPIFGIISILLYGYFIKKPTVEKLDLQSRILGFKEYLEMEDEDRRHMQDQPEMTIDHFESLLPYAFAFGIEKNWTSVFEDTLKNHNYHNNHSWIYYDVGFGRRFHQTIGASSVQPQSSSGGGFSGSSGGGFSGGGGGGGSVGGW